MNLAFNSLPFNFSNQIGLWHIILASSVFIAIVVVVYIRISNRVSHKIRKIIETDRELASHIRIPTTITDKALDEFAGDILCYTDATRQYICKFKLPPMIVITYIDYIKAWEQKGACIAHHPQISTFIGKFTTGFFEGSLGSHGIGGIGGIALAGVINGIINGMKPNEAQSNWEKVLQICDENLDSTWHHFVSVARQYGVNVD